MEKTIFLIGFMGSGKTYWGSRIAEKTGIPFYDLDALIEARESTSVQQVFARSGEDHFRNIERVVLHQCTLLGPALVATGGGTPCFFDNINWMNAHGHTIYLKTPAAVLSDRLKHERQFRPLLATVEEHALETHIEKLLEHREPFYAQATVVLEYDGDEVGFFERLLRRVKHT